MLQIKDYFDPADDRLQVVNRLYAARPALTLAMICLAFLGLAINLLETLRLIPTVFDRAATHPLTAACLILLAVALFLLPRGWRFRKLACWLCFVAGAIAMTNMAVAALHAGTPRPVPLFRGSMSLDTSTAVVLLALSTGLYGRLHRPAMACLAGFLLIVLNSVTGLTFGVTYFGGQMAPLTLLSLCCAAVLAISINANQPLVRIILLTSEVGVRTRVMAAMGTFVPWAAGLFLYRVWGMPTTGFQMEAMMLSLIMGSTIIVAILSGYQHQVADELRIAAERRLAEQAVTDGLTGLRNRSGLTQTLRRRIAELKSTGRQTGIVMLDLDHFKQINDTHGHDEGDRVLVSVARCVEPLLRQGDIFGRWGGEEFMLIADMRQTEELAMLVERLRAAIHDLSRQTGRHCDTGSFNISASFGIADMRPGDRNYNDAVKRADLALYAAKTGGRNRVALAPGLMAQVA